jgi:hypothetical protein
MSNPNQDQGAETAPEPVRVLGPLAEAAWLGLLPLLQEEVPAA